MPFQSKLSWFKLGYMSRTSRAVKRCFSINEFVLADGHSPFGEWLNCLTDTDARAGVRIQLDRFSLGYLGNYSALANGVFVLRMSGHRRYRVYFGLHNGRVMLLLGGGTRQTSRQDLEFAKANWVIFNQRQGSARRAYQDRLTTALRDPEEAIAYVNAALEAGDRPTYLLAIRNVTSCCN